MEINEKFCPTCKNVIDRRAVACVHCGTLFDVNTTNSILMTAKADIPKVPTSRLDRLYVDPSMIPEEGIALYAEGMAKPACLKFAKELILGRKGVDADGTSDGSLLNLSELGGYMMGISRRHAVIRRTEDMYEVIDLGSTNGSWLNGVRLIPNRPYKLANGSQLRFGRMQLLFLCRTAAMTKAVE